MSSRSISRPRVWIPLFAFDAEHESINQRLDLLHVRLFLQHGLAGACFERKHLRCVTELPRPPSLLRIRRLNVVPLVVVCFQEEADQTVAPGLESAFDVSAIPEKYQSSDSL